jgi:ABC-type Na+ efflux pump permease subunit
MFKYMFLIIKKDFLETIMNKSKLWPFFLTLIPLLIFFYNKGTESLFPLEVSIYFIPVFISSIIAMQLSSVSMLDEKKYKMLDVLYAMKIEPIIITIAKIIYSVIFSFIISIIIIISLKYASIYVF